METSAYFENIHSHIIEALKRAEHDITIAVAWFTDVDIFRALCQKAARRIPVKLMILDHEFNTGERGLNFQQLRECGGEVFIIPERESGNIMHHKFCVLDHSTVITGSYNWSRRARDNNEDIVVISGATEFALQYLDTFNQILLRNGYPIKDVPRLDTESVVRRLELVRNLLLLGEYGDMRVQLNKLRQVPAGETLLDIISQLERQAFDAAVEKIAQYTLRLRALTKYRDPEIERLKQELRALEFQVNALSDQKAEIERQVNEFLHQHNLKLGRLIVEYLRLRKIHLKRKVEEMIEDAEEAELTSDEIEDAKEEYLGASEDYEEYWQEYQELAEQEPPPQLDEAQRAELKRLYKKASLLCHPDRVPDEKKELAHEFFIQLQTAYRANDVETVQGILAQLEQGQFFVDQSVALTESEQLRRAIADLQAKLDQLRAELNELRATETYRTLSQIQDWNQYFKDKQYQLETEIETLRAVECDDAA
jgi:hypothetical protein